ncbi:MAG: hypothetical protein HC770_06260 [Pseudanabaena sp. CRU_2_10]|nr:hypothetical protein [Pseudanabaena sp. CRU_2_10]
MDKMDPSYKEGMELVKDRYGSERRKAKILNFSLAYGKTEYGLSKDFSVSLAEAKQIVDRWYKSRPEVRERGIVVVACCLAGCCGHLLCAAACRESWSTIMDDELQVANWHDCCETKCEEGHRSS